MNISTNYRKISLLAWAALAIAALDVSVMFLVKQGSVREHALAIILPVKGTDPKAEVKKHLREFEVSVITGSSARSLHSKISKALFGEEVPLPLTLLLKTRKLIGIVIGVPSEKLWSEVATRISSNKTPFIAYSGPKEILLKCVKCHLMGNVEEIFELSTKDSREMLQILGEMYEQSLFPKI